MIVPLHNRFGLVRRARYAVGNTSNRAVKYPLLFPDEQIHCAAWPSFSLYQNLSKALPAESASNVNQI